MRMFDAARQPTMRRLWASVTNHAQATPDQVATWVRSATHSRFGASAVKSRSTRSGGRGASGSARAVRIFFVRLTPRIPSRPMRRATWSRPMSCPARLAAIHSSRAPYTE